MVATDRRPLHTRAVTAGLATLLLGAASARPVPQERAAQAAPRGVPFAVGEALEYELQAKWLLISGRGEASLRVEAIDTVHGFPAYRLAFRTHGGLAIFRLDNLERSWLDVAELFSRRFQQKHNSTRDHRDRTYDFFPDSMRYVNVENPADTGELASARPLDDVSFIYYVRTLPLVVGEEYIEPRYYKASGNPVSVRVLRTERIVTGAGEFDAIVVRPIVRTSGLFRDGGEAEVWLSNDARRLLLRLKAKAKVGTVTMELRSYTAGDPSTGFARAIRPQQR